MEHDRYSIMKWSTYLNSVTKLNTGPKLNVFLKSIELDIIELIIYSLMIIYS